MILKILPLIISVKPSLCVICCDLICPLALLIENGETP